MTALQITVVAILDHATDFEWTVQGFGMLRLYIKDFGRLHIWDSALRYPDVSMVHNHSWDLQSTIVSGEVVNTRYKRIWTGDRYHGHRIVCGVTFDGTVEANLGTVNLSPELVETLGPGQNYKQEAHEIHRTDAADGTVTIMKRQLEDVAGQADIYWPYGTKWGSAKPRIATTEEITNTADRALVLLDSKSAAA